MSSTIHAMIIWNIWVAFSTENDTIKNINILTARQPENDFQIIYNAKSKTNELIQFQEDFSHDGKTFKRITRQLKMRLMLLR